MKTERGGRVFPESDHSSDVIRVLSEEMKRLGVRVRLHTAVRRIVEKDGRFSALYLADGTKVEADACIIATGGNSYQTTGSDGDGYRFARELGHSCDGDPAGTGCRWRRKRRFVKDLQGLSLSEYGYHDPGWEEDTLRGFW